MILPSIAAIDRELFYKKYESTSITGTLAVPLYYNGLRISVAPKLAPIFTDEFEDWEYILLEGGRGGAKSETVAERLIMAARQETTRILCTREIQNTIKDSVKQVLEDWIKFLGFESEFRITNEAIIHKRTKTDFIFMGLRAGTDKDSMKSLKGVKYVWVEEAQTLSEESQDKLDPTIRVEGRKIYYTYNRRTDKDTVEKIKKKHKAHVIRINYYDNPFLPQVLWDQAQEMKEFDHDKYLHVWEGQPLPEDANRVILPYSWLSKFVDLHLKVPFAKIDLNDYKKVGGFDVADGMTTKHDKNALVVRQGPVVIHAEEWQLPEVYKSVKHINSRYATVGFSKLYYDAVGVGTAAKSEFARINSKLKKLPYKVYAFKGGKEVYGKKLVFTGEGPNKVTNGAMFANPKAQTWWNLRLRAENSLRLLRGQEIDRKDYFLSFSSEIPNLDRIFMELAQATYEEDNSGKIKVDKAPGVREVIVEGKRKTEKSPNLGDGTNYAFAGDLAKGLRAFQPASKKVKVIG